MGVTQSFIESADISGDVEFIVQSNNSGRRVTISIDSPTGSTVLYLTPGDLFKMLPIMQLAATYVKQTNK